MKYRCLTDDELKELEDEFKQFLIVNEVYNEEWEELNTKKDVRVGQLVEMFSDIVLEKALKNVKCLEYITKTDIKAFKCDTDQMTLIGIVATNDSVDFTTDALSDLGDQLSIFKVDKPYAKEREKEIFDLLESGCSVIDEKRFSKLELAYAYSTKHIKN